MSFWPSVLDAPLLLWSVRTSADLGLSSPFPLTNDEQVMEEKVRLAFLLLERRDGRAGRTETARPRQSEPPGPRRVPHLLADSDLKQPTLTWLNYRQALSDSDLPLDVL